MDALTVANLADAVEAGAARLDGRTTRPPAGVVAIATPTVEAIRAIIARTARPARSGKLSCLVEAIDVDYEHGEPAATYLADAIRRGSHAVSANKGPVVHHRAALLALAAEHRVRYLHESAVMDGVPIFSAWRGGFLPGGARLTRFRGCLNATTGVVLSGMEAGQSMADALKTAQDAGIAEADPSGDLKGMDAAVKLVALAIAFELGGAGGGGSGGGDGDGGDGDGPPPPPPCLRLSDVDISGIDHVTPQMAMEARQRGKRLRLVACAEAVMPPSTAAAASADNGGAGGTAAAAAPQWVPLSARRQDEAARRAAGPAAAAPAPRIKAYVRCEELSPGDPLYGLEGADSAVMLETDCLAPVTIAQRGSEVTDTAFGEYADILRACRPVAV